MKKTFVVLWCALAGCSIIPDDAFETTPQASLKEITITSNVGQSSDTLNDPMPPSLSLTGLATISGNKTTIEWSGSLNPFPYTSAVRTTEYQVDGQGRLSGVTVTLEDDRTQTEVITYSEEGRLNQLVVTAADSTSTYSFFYNDEGIIDTVRKVMVRPGKAQKIGIYYTENQPGVQYFGVYPYNEDESVQNEDFYCNSLPWSQLPNTVNGFRVSVGDDGHNFKTLYKNGESYKSLIQEAYVVERDFSVLTGRTVQKRVDFYFSGADCGRTPGFLSHYFLFPGGDAQLNYLLMVTMNDQMRAVAANPGELPRIHDLDIKYTYNFAE